MGDALFAPVSANPLGFHHLALVEWVLRCNPNLTEVVFVPSNGRHPDPTKANASAPTKLRLELCRLLLHQAPQPSHSALARQAAQAKTTLRLGASVPWQVNELELTFKGSVRLWEQVEWLQKHGHATPQTKLDWLVGADLMVRMADEAIFSQPDLTSLSHHLHLHVVDRGEQRAHTALQQLQHTRQLHFDATCYALKDIPGWLRWFLPLSSTHIRHALYAQDALEGMLSTAAAAHFRKNQPFHHHHPQTAAQADPTHAVQAAETQGDAHSSSSALTSAPSSAAPVSNRWENRCQALQTQLLKAGQTLATRLLANQAKGLPYSLCAVENSTAGWLTIALGAKAGASAFLQQTHFVYSQAAKQLLLQAPLPDKAVSQASVEAMAIALRRQTHAHFCLCESGTAGPPNGVRKTQTQGQCWLAWASQTKVQSTQIAFNPYLTRREHHLLFSLHAIRWVTALLDA